MASVLLVGIHDPDRRTVCSALEAAGHTVSDAPTRAFLRRVRERPVDLVLIDVSPLMHAVHLVGIAELRAQHPALPIIAASGGPDADMLLKIAVRAGATLALRKPVAPAQLREAVARCLAGGAPP
jgi:CheY-like chemotaxis protein